MGCLASLSTIQAQEFGCVTNLHQEKINILRRFIGIVMIVSCLNQAHAAPSDDFVIVVKSDNPGPSGFTIPTQGSGYNYNVDCNDDGILEATAQTGDYTCDYSALGGPGTHTVRIKDNSGNRTGFPRISFNSAVSRLKIISIAQWGTGTWDTMRSAFSNTSNMTVDATDVPDLSMEIYMDIHDMNFNLD